MLNIITTKSIRFNSNYNCSVSFSVGIVVMLTKQRDTEMPLYNFAGLIFILDKITFLNK